MANFVNMYVTDAHLSTSKTWKYDSVLPSGDDDTETLVEGLLLFPQDTARTNVCFKGADGKFVSYRNLNNHDVRFAVETLKPFPTPASN